MDSDLTIFLKGRLRVHQPVKGYRFNVDSVLLAGLSHVREGERVLDLGSGCGILLLLLKEYGHPAHLAGAEIDPEMAGLASRNLIENGLEECSSVYCADLREWEAPGGATFDLVIANPPYYRRDAGLKSPDRRRAAARHDHDCGISDIFRAAARALSEKGRLCFVIPFERLGEALSGLPTEGLHPWLIRPVCPDPGTPPHLAIVQARRARRAPGALTFPPFPIRVSEGLYSPFARALLREVAPEGKRFFCDCMLGTLARNLRLVGADASYARSCEDDWLLSECIRSGRTMLTRDRRLIRAAEKAGAAAFDPGSDTPKEQAGAVLKAFGIAPGGRPPRCLDCNVAPLEIPRASARGEVPHYTFLTRERFRACPCCGKLTWEGSHLERFRRQLAGEVDLQ